SIYEGLNDYVLGLKGSYRPEKAVVAIKDRGYSTIPHVRMQGTFSLSKLYWEASATSANCAPNSLVSAVGGLDPSWKTASRVTKYDMFGNGIEEQDATEVYSSAHFGFNKRKPIAVVTN